MSCDGLRMYEALYQLWAAVQSYHPEVPDVMLCVTDNGLGAASTAHDRWNNDQPEVYLSGADMPDTYELLSSVLHEAAHCALGPDPEAQADGRVHTWQFRNKAVELGMGKFMPVAYRREFGWATYEVQAWAMKRYAAEVADVTGLGLVRRQELEY